MVHGEAWRTLTSAAPRPDAGYIRLSARERDHSGRIRPVLHARPRLRPLPRRPHHALVSRGRCLLDRRVRHLRRAHGGVALPRRAPARGAPHPHARATGRGGDEPAGRVLGRRSHAKHPRPLPRPRPAPRRVLRLRGAPSAGETEPRGATCLRGSLRTAGRDRRARARSWPPPWPRRGAARRGRDGRAPGGWCPRGGRSPCAART